MSEQRWLRTIESELYLECTVVPRLFFGYKNPLLLRIINQNELKGCLVTKNEIQDHGLFYQALRVVGH